jgi:glyoxylase-like metal-dependent hydrolase (beta-lactamase superfamily II)
MKNLVFRATAAVLLLAGVYAVASQQAPKDPFEKPTKLAEGVYIRQSHDIGKNGSNVGWIEFNDFVVVIDTAFPLGAEEAIGRIKETTKNKPIKYAIVTHYHADHSFGNGVFAKEGAMIVAHENARKEYLEKNVKAYGESAEKDPAYAKYAPLAPNLTFTDKFIIDDGSRRAEIHFLGHAHTTGCVWTWLPKEKVLFTGDACVNGAFNYMGDSDSASWIEVLTKAQALGAEKIGPGHGAAAGGELLETQKKYFVELRAQVGKLVKEGKSQDEVKAAVDIPMWKQWTGQQKMSEPNILHVYKELKK